MPRFQIADCTTEGHGRCRRSGCRYHERDARDGCALTEASGGPHSLQEIGHILGVTRERIRQIECEALRHLSEALGPELRAELLDQLRQTEARQDSLTEPEPVADGAAITIILRRRARGQPRGLRGLPRRRRRLCLAG